MAQKTSINIKPCNIGSSEAHNKRTAEYLANIPKEKFYIRTDLMAKNEEWVSPEPLWSRKRQDGRCRPKTGKG